MKRDNWQTHLILFCFVLCASFAFGQAGKSTTQQRRSSGTRTSSAWDTVDAAQLLRDVDADHDGEITRAEWETYFKNHDENGSDRLTPGEMPQSRNISDYGESQEPAHGRQQAFERLDKNSNSFIERSEWPGTDRPFKKMDANRDGVISLEEFLSMNGLYWNELFSNLDFDNNHAISRSEWLDSERSFERFDRNKDGIIDRWEFYDPR